MQTHAIPKKATNVTLDAKLLGEARALGINLSQAAEAGLRQAVIEARRKAWREENAAALASSNAWVDRHGLPLDRHRQF